MKFRKDKTALYHLREAIKMLRSNEDGELTMGGNLPNNPMPTITEALVFILTGLYQMEKNP